MWRHNWIEEIEEMGVQSWSLPGSTQQYVGRTWTGIGVAEDQSPFVVYADGYSGAHVNPKLKEQIEAQRGRHIATICGWTSAQGLLVK